MSGTTGGMFDQVGQMGADQGLMGLLGAAGGFAQAALPTPYRGGTPWGAVLGMGAQGMGQGFTQGLKNQGTQASTIGQQISNVGAAAQLPLLQARAKAMQDAYSDPTFMGYLRTGQAPGAGGAAAPSGGTPLPSGGVMPTMGTAPASAPVAPVAGAPGAPTIAGGALTKSPITGVPAPTLTTVKSAGGVPFRVAASAAPQFQGLVNDLEATGYKINPQSSGGYNDRFIAGTKTPSQHAYGLAIDVNSDTNARGANTPSSIPPELGNALAKKWGLTWGGNWSGDTRDPMHFEVAATAPAASGTTSVANDAGLPASAIGAATPAASGANPTAQNALDAYKEYEARARWNTARQQFGLPTVEDPAVLHATAQQYLKLALAGPQAGSEAAAKAGVDLATAGPIQLAKSRNSNIDLRPGGMELLPDGNGNMTVVKNPELKPVVDAAGQTTYAHFNPASPFDPPGTPGQSAPVLDAKGQPVVEALPPQLQAAREAAVHDLTTKDQDSYQAAQNTNAWLSQIDHAADVMNKSGPQYQTGPYAQTRYGLMNGINDISRTFGVKTPFDEKALASAQELTKATTTAGFELASHYEGHARQAASTIMNATSAVPGMGNSPLGLLTVSSGIHEGAQSATDVHQYKQAVFNATNGAQSARAETDYYEAHPAEQYAQRAISNVTPIVIKPPADGSAPDLTKYLPGTFVTDGKTIDPATGRPKIVQIPPRTEQIGGIPYQLTVPTYMQKSAAPAPGAAPNGQ